MTDLPDELRERLPGADRIRDRIREQREADGPRSETPDARMKMEDIPGETQRHVGDLPETGLKMEDAVKFGDSKLADGELIDDITAVAPESVVDHKADDFVGKVVDHKADDIAGLKMSGVDSKVVDHKSDDIAGLKMSGVDSKVVDHKADDVMSQPADESLKHSDLEAQAQVEIDVTANIDAGADPVGDALAPLDGGADEYQALPDFDASIDAATPELLGSDETHPADGG